MKHFLMAALLMAGGTAIAQTSLTPYRPGVTQEGVVYFLPKTAVNIRVLAVRTTYTPGDFCQYAQRYLRVNDVKSTPDTQYEIISVQQDAVGVADTSKCYAIAFNPKSAAPNVCLADDGVLLAIQAEPRRQEAIPVFRAAPQPVPVNPRQYMNAEILAAGSTAKMAELTANEIYDIRENRNLLTRGQADFMPKDGEQLRLMLAHLEEQDRALTSLFTGTIHRDTIEYQITYLPQQETKGDVLFRFSKRLGMVDADDLAGEPYYISISNRFTTPEAAPVADAKKKKKENGVYVNVPGRIRSVIRRGNEEVSAKEMMAGQFGEVELISDQLFNKRYTTHLRLDPISGGIEKLEAEQPK